MSIYDTDKAKRALLEAASELGVKGDGSNGRVVFGPNGSLDGVSHVTANGITVRPRGSAPMRCADCDAISELGVKPQDFDVFVCPHCRMPNVAELRYDLVIYRMLMPHEIDSMTPNQRAVLATQSRITYHDPEKPRLRFRSGS